MMIEKIGDATLHTGDCIAVMESLAEKSVQTCITSPPYFGLRDYGNDAQIGLEDTPDAYVAKIVDVFRAVRRVLKDDGTVWLNLGDSYASNHGSRSVSPGDKQGTNAGSLTDSIRRPAKGLKQKDLIGIPWRAAFALQADGWYLRQDIIWAKPNPMPESVTDRCTKSHEYIFLLSKNAKYYYDAEAIKEPVAASTVARMAQDIENQAGSGRVPGKMNGPMKAVLSKSGNTQRKQRPGPDSHTGKQAGSIPWEGSMRNKRDVWTVTTRPYKGAHFATFPPLLIEPCILAGCPVGGTVLDPFSGSGTTGEVALNHSRKYIGIELNPEYQQLAMERIKPFANQGRLFE